MIVSNPNIQIDDEIREMTDEEMAALPEPAEMYNAE